MTIKNIAISGKKRHGKNLVGKIIEYLTSSDDYNPKETPENRLADFSFFCREGAVNNSFFKSVSIADPLRKMASVIINCKPEVLELEYMKNSFLQLGDKALSVRTILQMLGISMRELFGENIWIDTALRDNKSENILVTDLRFPNEYEILKQLPSLLLRVERPGTILVYYNDKINSDEEDHSGYYFVQKMIPVTPNSEYHDYVLTQEKDGTGHKIQGRFNNETVILSPTDSHISETALDSYYFNEVIINDGTILELIEKIRIILTKYNII